MRVCRFNTVAEVSLEIVGFCSPYDVATYTRLLHTAGKDKRILPNHLLTRLHGVIRRNVVIFVFSAVGVSSYVFCNAIFPSSPLSFKCSLPLSIFQLKFCMIRIFRLFHTCDTFDPSGLLDYCGRACNTKWEPHSTGWYVSVTSGLLYALNWGRCLFIE